MPKKGAAKIKGILFPLIVYSLSHMGIVYMELLNGGFVIFHAGLY